MYIYTHTHKYICIYMYIHSSGRSRARIMVAYATFLPPTSTSVMVFDSPGSKRMLEPAGTFSRMPYEAARSNTSAALVSMK